MFSDRGIEADGIAQGLSIGSASFNVVRSAWILLVSSLEAILRDAAG
jgi:hypothetical protein